MIEPKTAPTGPDGRPLPGPGQVGVLLVLALVAALQGYSWWLLEGYQLADSVEYMERAQAWVRSQEVIDAQQIRSFGFSGLLVPFFWVAERLNVQDFKPLVAILRLFQMGLGLGLVLVSMRIGARLGGRGTGLLAGLLVGINPIFLQFSVSPVADVAAALCLALAFERLLEPGGLGAGLGAGAWMGAGLMMAYKTVPLSAILVGLVVLRDRLRGRRTLAGIALGLSAGVALQATLDRAVYGSWGISLITYFGENVVGVINRLLVLAGFQGLAVDLGTWFYGSTVGLEGQRTGPLHSLAPADWYLTHLPEMLPWPVIAMAALALIRCLGRGTWRSTMALVAVGAYVLLLSQKGAKDFRLWFPVLSMLGPLLGWGLAWILGRGGRGRRGPRGVWRAALATLLLVSATVAGVRQLLSHNTRKFSGYWQAMEYVSERAAQAHARDPGAPRVPVASAYHWGVYLRESADVRLTKLPRQVHLWELHDESARAAVLEVLLEQEWFIVHLPVLTHPTHGELTRAVSAAFEVQAMFWDPRTSEDIGPILVLKRVEDGGFDLRRRTLFEVLPDGLPGVLPEGSDRGEPGGVPRALSRLLGAPEPVRLIRPDLGEEIRFLGFTYEVLPGDGHGWITYYFHCVAPCTADYTIVDRVTTYDERHSWQDDHAPAYGVLPTSRWEAGWIVREGRPLVAAQDPYDWHRPLRPLGGPYRRGDLIPAFLWLDLATFDRGHVTGRLQRARFGEDEPVRRGPLEGVLRTEEGWRFSPDGLNHVGSFLLPVHPTARVPDDGRPIPD